MRRNYFTLGTVLVASFSGGCHYCATESDVVYRDSEALSDEDIERNAKTLEGMPLESFIPLDPPCREDRERE